MQGLGKVGTVAANNPALTGGLLGATVGGLAKGGKGALAGGLLGGAAGYGAGQMGLLGEGAEATAGALGSNAGQITRGAGGAVEVGGQALPTLGSFGNTATSAATPLATEPFRIGGATLGEIGKGLSGAGSIYSAITGAGQSKDLIDLQKQQVRQGLLQSREADKRRDATQSAAASGFGNYYYA